MDRAATATPRRQRTKGSVRGPRATQDAPVIHAGGGSDETRQLSRRCLLQYLGAGAAAGLLSSNLLGPLARANASPAGALHERAIATAWTDDAAAPRWAPPAYPVPHPGAGG